jgi:predicted RNA binding protein YcfA (HicA-like mRNA interferase family)
MTKRGKLLSEIRDRPNSVRFEELTKLLGWYGFELRRVKGSHHLYQRGPHNLVIPRHTPHVHSYVVKQVLKMIDGLAEEKE